MIQIKADKSLYLYAALFNSISATTFCSINLTKFKSSIFSPLEAQLHIREAMSHTHTHTQTVTNRALCTRSNLSPNCENVHLHV